MQLPKPNNIEFERVEPGTYAARCYRFIDLGTQPKVFKGETKLVHQVRLSWELPTELMTKGDVAGKPFGIHNSYTWSMSDKAILRKSLESWRGRKFTEADFGATGFNTKKLIGVACMLGISSSETNGKTYSNVTSISPLLKGYAMPDAVNEPLYFSFDEAMLFNAPERAMYINQFLDKMSQGTRDAIVGCPEYKKALGVPEKDYGDHAPEPDDRDYSDSIPF